LPGSEDKNGLGGKRVQGGFRKARGIVKEKKIIKHLVSCRSVRLIWFRKRAQLNVRKMGEGDWAVGGVKRWLWQASGGEESICMGGGSSLKPVRGGEDRTSTKGSQIINGQSAAEKGVS